MSKNKSDQKEKDWKEIADKSEEPETQEDLEENLEADIEEMTLQKTIEDYETKLLKKEAELQNTIRRAKLDVENAHKYGVKKLLEELISVVDTLEEALKALEQDAHTSGVKLTLQQLLDTLLKFGVIQLNPVGEEFDPNHHEAIATQKSNEIEEGYILTVFQKGYILNGRVVRPARVIVAKK